MPDSPAGNRANRKRDEAWHPYGTRKSGTCSENWLQGGGGPEEVPAFYPAVTLLLYFGDTRWRGSLHLKDHLKIPKGLEGYVSDYTANLFEIAFLTDEQVEMFQSDFRFVAEYFVAVRKKKEGLAPTFRITLDHLQHVEAFKDLMNAVTNSRRFSGLPKFIEEKGGDAVLTVFFDEAEARGLARGEIEKLIKQITRKQAAGQSAAKIAEDLMEDSGEVDEIYDLVRENGGASPQTIYELYAKETQESQCDRGTGTLSHHRGSVQDAEAAACQSLSPHQRWGERNKQWRSPEYQKPSSYATIPMGLANQTVQKE